MPIQCIEEYIWRLNSDKSSWPDVVPDLDLWIKNNKWNTAVLMLEISRKLTAYETLFGRVSGAKQWCVDKGYASLAFVMALADKDWGFAENVLASFSSLDLHFSIFLGAARMAFMSTDGTFSTAVKFLAACPMSNEMLDSRCCRALANHSNLAKECEKQGLWSFALRLQCQDRDYLMQNHRFCENRTMLDWILRRAICNIDCFRKGQWWSLAHQLITGCTDVATLRIVLHAVTAVGNLDAVRMILGHVDPSVCTPHERNNTLLFTSLFSFKLRSLYLTKSEISTLVRLFLDAGLSVFQRNMDAKTATSFTIKDVYAEMRCCLRPNLPYNCLLQCAFSFNLPDVISMTLAYGAHSNKTLFAVANDAEIEDLAEKDEDLRRCFKRVQEAACTPPCLEFLAQLAVSLNVGCHPGRFDRIDQLPLAPHVKEKVKFTDVLNPEVDHEHAS